MPSNRTGGYLSLSRIQVLGAILLLAAVTTLQPGSAAAASVDSDRRARAAEDPRLDPRLGVLLQTESEKAAAGAPSAPADTRVAVFVKGNVDRAELEALGITVRTEAGSIRTADVGLASLPDLLDVHGVEEVEAPSRMQTLLDVSAPEAGADDQWGDPLSPYAPPYPGLTGAGVIVGIVDTGIDLAHPDFQNGAGQTRVKYLWDQTWGIAHPPGFGYGTEWTQSQINGGQCNETDTDGHGTHIAGIAAGNGRATGHGFPNYRYVGIAPEADLVVVKSNLMTDKVLDGVNYVFQKATALGKDAVVLVALGVQRGGHDGSYSLDTAMSALTGPGRVIVAAAGNYAGQAIHGRVDLVPSASSALNFTVPTHTPNPSWNEFLELEGWHESTSSFRVKLTSPSGHTTNWLEPGTTSGTIATSDGAFLVRNAMDNNGRGALKIRVYLYEAGGYTPKAGTWRIDLQNASATANSLVDAWIADSYFSSSTAPVFTSHVDMTRLVSSPATADGVIAVGAYTTKRQWLNVNGTYSFYLDNPPMWTISSFSSTGPRRDGVQRPDFCAPGCGAMGAMSANAGIAAQWQAEDGCHSIRKGTSVAAAHAAGAVALLLEGTPNMGPDVVRAVLAASARGDSYTGQVPNGTWGAGKLFITSPDISSVEDPVRATGYLSPQPNPFQNSTTFAFSLTESPTTRDGVQLRIVDPVGRQVELLSGTGSQGQQRITWNGTDYNGHPAPPGIYFARLEGTRARTVWKFVRSN